MAEPSALLMTLTTAVGPALKFRSMVARDEVSRLFEYQIIAVSTDPKVDADQLLGTPVSVSIEVADGVKRWFHGIVASFGIEGVDGRHFSYRITARPALWLLTRAANVRIFQDKSVPDIVKEVLDAYGSEIQLMLQLSGTHNARSYCVQYRETDFNFVSRLLEEEGIFYFFRHGQDKHELVLADAPAVHEPMTGFEQIDYVENEDDLTRHPAVNQWRMRHEIQTGKVTLRDHDFEKPETDLTSTPAQSSRSHAQAAFEAYDYPGLYRVKGDGSALANLRLEEAEGRFGRFSGQGNTPGLVSGAKFALAGHPRDDQNADYIVLSTQIDMQQAGYEASKEQDTLFLCRFVAQRFAEPLRPARTTRKPTVSGPQTAVVVGEGGAGDIYTDKFGRVKVQFHWDRKGAKDGKSSCWMRVASPLAGSGWGAISLPRIGQEVVVDFLEGDPDQPLITGRVHNASQMPPYALPDHKSVSTLKSRSVKGGAADFNELRFEDKKGQEYLLLHAQKDRFEFVEETLKSEIKKEEHRTVEEDRKEKVGGEYHLTVAKDVKQKLDGKLSIKAAKDILIGTDGLHSLKAVKDITAESGTAYSIKVGTDLHIKAGKNVGVDGGMNVHIKGGMNVVIEGGMQMTLKAGAGSVVLGPDGVSITGPLVKINSGGAPGSGAGASPVAPTAPEAPVAPDLPKDPLSHR